MFEKKAGNYTLIYSDLIEKIDGIVHGFGLRGITGPEYLDAIGVKDHFVFQTDQVHGSTVHYLMRSKESLIIKGDAFISDRPGIVCFVRTADCVPILLADRDACAVAAVHAGWRGSAGNIVGKTIAAMRDAFSVDPGNLVAAIGPSICGRCYEVGGEVIDALSSLRIGDSWCIDSSHADLKAANRLLLEAAGVPASSIDVSDRCTFCEDAFNSYRRDKNEEGRQHNFIMIA
ncbi:MAG TPA: peptidoglycan editing factor PgeF [bacterium]|nr:MAG: Laccase domain protein YfiH [bacterium ADurb.Bin270]HPW45488.1 peptidoglycan editing factor PgeF [bacterium]HQC51002.1 peptidoglycan editing factor PgeF [bacterium]